MKFIERLGDLIKIDKFHQIAYNLGWDDFLEADNAAENTFHACI